MVLVSHRWHAPPIDGVRLELDRAVFPGWVLRRALVHGVVQDERLTTATLGRGAPAGRSRLLVTLAGRTTVFARGSDGLEAPVAIDVPPGHAVVIRDLGAVELRSEPGCAFEIDWDPASVVADGSVADLDAGPLGATARSAVDALCSALRAGRPTDRSAILAAASRLVGALDAEGLPLSARGVDEERASLEAQLAGPAASGDDDLQRLCDAFDAELEALDRGPALVTIEGRLGWSRRTVARRARDASDRYGISALSGEDWRSARDFYRLLLGTIFASHEAATTNRLAVLLGYSSPAALCHAFARAGLASPVRLGERARRA